jgi:hypothetical protein
VHGVIGSADDGAGADGNAGEDDAVGGASADTGASTAVNGGGGGVGSGAAAAAAAAAAMAAAAAAVPVDAPDEIPMLTAPDKRHLAGHSAVFIGDVRLSTLKQVRKRNPLLASSAFSKHAQKKNNKKRLLDRLTSCFDSEGT